MNKFILLNKMSNDKNKNKIESITLLISNELFVITEKELIYKLTPILSQNYSKSLYNQQKNYFCFPLTIDKNSFELFCTFLIYPLQVDFSKLTNLKKIIDICLFLNTIPIISQLIEEEKHLKPDINNCIEIVNLFLDYIYEKNETVKNIFIKIIQDTLIYIAKNLIELIDSKLEDLYSLNGETLEEIIELYFKYVDTQKNSKKNLSNVIELLMYNRGIKSDIFMLLENERKKAIRNFEDLFNDSQNKIEPNFIWNISYDDTNKQNYQETTTSFDGLNILLISYYVSENDNFQLALQILDEDSNNNINNSKDDFLEDKITFDDDTNTAKKIQNKNITESNNNLINILSLCEISEINFKSHINFNGIYSKNKSRFLVFKLDNFRKKFININNNIENNKIKFFLKIYFSRNYVFSQIIKHICQNFDKYYKYDSITKIPRSAMNILLKNENFIQKNEYYKLYAVENWFKNRKNSGNSKKFLDIFKNIDWKKISNSELIDFFINNAKLLSNEISLKHDIFFEIQRRFQEEYSEYSRKNKIYFMDNFSNMSSNSFSNSNSSYDNDYNYLSFTYDFLSKIINYITSKNSNIDYNGEIYNDTSESYPINNQQNPTEEKIINPNITITQRNKNIPKHKISKSIMLSESPIENFNEKKTQLLKKIDIKNNTINIINKKCFSTNIKNEITNTVKLQNHIKNINNIPSNRALWKKNSSNNSMSSYQNQINLSGISGAAENFGLLSTNNDNSNTKKKLNLIDKSIENILINKGFKSFTPNHADVIKNNKKINKIKKISQKKSLRTVSCKPSRTQNKINHSKSSDKNLMNSGNKNSEIENNILNNKELSGKKIGMFPKYIRSIQGNEKNYHLNKLINYKNTIQIKRKMPIKELNGINLGRIPIQYNSCQKNDIITNDEINNKGDKIPLFICKNNDILTTKKKSNSKKSKK